MGFRNVVGMVGLGLVSALAACGSDSSTLPTGNVAAGMAAVTTRNCKTCHAADLAGSADVIPGSMVYSSNITPDNATGIGSWTDAALDAVLRQGKDDAGRQVCAPMPIYNTMTAQESADIIAYLRSVPPVTREVTESECP